jgi:hypothetical protein
MALSENVVLRIGKVVYIITKKTQTILPVIIKEKNICETINGEKVTFKVLVGEPGKQKLFDLSKIDSEIFGSIEEVKEYLTKGFITALDTECDKAVQYATDWYGPMMIQEGQSLPGEEKKYDAEDLLQELSQPMAPQQQQAPYQNQVQNYNLQQIQQNPDTIFIQLPDGTVRPVRQ